MPLHTAAYLGAFGGSLVSASSFSSDIFSWQEGRKKQRLANRGPVISMMRYVDPVSDILALLTRAGLGVAAACIFRHEVTGSIAAVAVGASAPGIIAQFGKRTFPDFVTEPEDERKSAAKNENIGEMTNPVPQQGSNSPEIRLPEEQL
jgi:hypothetical protein